MAANDLKSKLIADRVITKTEEYEIEGVGTIKFRALSRMEIIESGKIDDHAEQERFILSKAMIDPQMSVDDVAAWQKASPGYEINYLAVAINRLSGLKKGAAKSDVPGV